MGMVRRASLLNWAMVSCDGGASPVRLLGCGVNSTSLPWSKTFLSTYFFVYMSFSRVFVYVCIVEEEVTYLVCSHVFHRVAVIVEMDIVGGRLYITNLG